MSEHELKTLPPFLEEVFSGRKTFEVRRNDRGFAVGDVLRLREWSETDGYSGFEGRRTVSYVMPGGRYGLDPEFCILGLAPAPCAGCEAARRGKPD